MDKREIALQLLITAIENDRIIFDIEDKKTENAGKIIADLYNDIYNNLED